jgi:hypothetical protein
MTGRVVVSAMTVREAGRIAGGAVTGVMTGVVVTGVISGATVTGRRVVAVRGRATGTVGPRAVMTVVVGGSGRTGTVMTGRVRGVVMRSPEGPAAMTSPGDPGGMTGPVGPGVTMSEVVAAGGVRMGRATAIVTAIVTGAGAGAVAGTIGTVGAVASVGAGTKGVADRRGASGATIAGSGAMTGGRIVSLRSGCPSTTTSPVPRSTRRSGRS